jgi:hypothetical protein
MNHTYCMWKGAPLRASLRGEGELVDRVVVVHLHEPVNIARAQRFERRGEPFGSGAGRHDNGREPALSPS